MESSEAQVFPAPVPPPRAGTLSRHLLAVCIALLGGALGIAGAFVQEFRTGGFLLLPFLGAPIIEEGVKPAGIYIMLIRWPHFLRGQLHTALLTAISGLSFGVIEAVTYVTLYVSDPSDLFVAYRFTLPLVLHTTSSFIVGLGLNQRLLDWAQGRAPLPKASRNLFIAAASLHGLYNTVAMALWLSGVLDLD